MSLTSLSNQSSRCFVSKKLTEFVSRSSAVFQVSFIIIVIILIFISIIVIITVAAAAAAAVIVVVVVVVVSV